MAAGPILSPVAFAQSTETPSSECITHEQAIIEYQAEPPVDLPYDGVIMEGLNHDKFIEEISVLMGPPPYASESSIVFLPDDGSYVATIAMFDADGCRVTKNWHTWPQQYTRPIIEKVMGKPS